MSTIDKMLVVLNEPRSLIAESYRGLRTTMQRAFSNGVQTIMFVSTFGGDGKSTVCSNIAAALTQLYLEVVLVDCDLRRPTLTRLFDAPDHVGLADYLVGKATMDQILVPTSVERLRIIPAGNVLENPGDLLARPAQAEFCKAIREKCDVVLFDTSPLSACSDALALGAHMDSTIFVVSPKRWNGDVEVKARQSLEAHNIPVMGVILNGVDPNERGGYGYGYGYGQGYGYGRKRKEFAYGYGSYGDEGERSGSERERGGFFSRLSSWWGQ